LNKDTIHLEVKETAGLWPTEEQELLLKAALLDKQTALKAWHAWNSSVDINEIDHGSFQLLPLIYKQFSRLNAEEPLIGLLKGVYRSSWYKNQLLLEQASSLLQLFDASGIKTLMISEAACLRFYDQDIGLRPITEFEFLITAEHVFKAQNILSRAGWIENPESMRPNGPGGMKLSLRNSYTHSNTAGYELKINRQPTLYGVLENDYAALWQNSISINFRDIPIQTLSTTDLFFYICTENVYWKQQADFRWIADAWMLITKEGSNIDWVEILDQAQEKHLVLSIRDTLLYLQQKLNSNIPDEILQKLFATPVPKNFQKEYSILTNPVGLIGKAQKKWYQYQRCAQIYSPGSMLSMVGFLNYLQSVWGLDTIWQMPSKLIEKVFYGLGRVSSGLKGRNTSAK
jgi:hypothetical protein